jgi:hypothetical protein
MLFLTISMMLTLFNTKPAQDEEGVELILDAKTMSNYPIRYAPESATELYAYH